VSDTSFLANVVRKVEFKLLQIKHVFGGARRARTLRYAQGRLPIAPSSVGFRVG